jgi:hypothetical protein
MANRRVLTSVAVAPATSITTQSFAQDRGTGATPGDGRKGRSGPRYLHDERRPSMEARRSRGPPWTADVHGVGESKRGASLILQKYSAGMESGWHWHTAAYQGVVIQGKFTHTFEGAAPQTGGPGSVLLWIGTFIRDRSIFF